MIEFYNPLYFTKKYFPQEEADKYGRENARDEIEERRQVSWMKDLKRAIEIIVNVLFHWL